MMVGGQCNTPAVLPLGETQSPLYIGLGGPDDQCGQVPKIMPLPGFDPWNTQPLANHYTNYAITMYHVHYLNTYVT
jgi:hypothetical protein